MGPGYWRCCPWAKGVAGHEGEAATWPEAAAKKSARRASFEFEHGCHSLSRGGWAWEIEKPSGCARQGRLLGLAIQGELGIEVQH